MGRFQKRTAKKTNTGSASKAAASKGVSQRRSRTKYSPHQVATLKKAFSLDPYPGCPQLEELAGLLEICYDRLQVWFQNRRARDEEFRRGRKNKASREDPCPNNNLPEEEGNQQDAAVLVQDHVILQGAPIRERTPAWEEQPQNSQLPPDNTACFDGSQCGNVPAPGCSWTVDWADEGTQAMGWDGGVLLGAHPQLPGGNYEPVGACYPDDGGLWVYGDRQLGEQACPPHQQLGAPTDPRDFGQQWASSSSSPFLSGADAHGGWLSHTATSWGSTSSTLHSSFSPPQWSVANQGHLWAFQANTLEYSGMGSSEDPFQQAPHSVLIGQYPPFPST